jgi:hypothetical protein
MPKTISTMAQIHMTWNQLVMVGFLHAILAPYNRIMIESEPNFLEQWFSVHSSVAWASTAHTQLMLPRRHHTANSRLNHNLSYSSAKDTSTEYVSQLGSSSQSVVVAPVVV